MRGQHTFRLFQILIVSGNISKAKSEKQKKNKQKSQRVFTDPVSKESSVDKYCHLKWVDILSKANSNFLKYRLTEAWEANVCISPNASWMLCGASSKVTTT